MYGFDVEQWNARMENAHDADREHREALVVLGADRLRREVGLLGVPVGWDVERVAAVVLAGALDDSDAIGER